MLLWIGTIALLWNLPLVDAESLNCQNNVVMEGKVRTYDSRGSAEIRSSTRLAMSLHETACIKLKVANSSYSVMHSFEFSKLEQHYPVTGAYIFAVPLLSTSCFCGCSGRSHKCNIRDYSYRKCYVGSLCYRTYQSIPRSIGCKSNERSEQCCEIRFDSYENRSFTAVKLGQPATLAVFRYRVHEPSADGNWSSLFEEIVPVFLNQGYSSWSHHRRHKMRLEVTANRAFREMQPGMYYIENGDSEVYGYVIMNDIGETSLEKLGWFRFVDGEWDIRRGSINVRQAHNVYFTNCLEQTYYTAFDANYFVLNNNDGKTLHVDMGRSMSSDPWIDSATYTDRAVVVQHAEGLSVTMHVITETRPKIQRHSSELADFSGTIHVDEKSNYYLNITFFEARGTILGSIYTNETRSQLQGRVHVPIASGKKANFTTRISLAASFNSSQYVCFHPKDDPNEEICHWMRFLAKPLRKTDTQGDGKFYKAKGLCSGCNEESNEILEWVFGSFAMQFNETLHYLKVALLIGCSVFVTIGLCVVLYFVFKCIRFLFQSVNCIGNFIRCFL
uniref:Receptor protein-tyrosine kinase n=1 Tax=Haemonchus contortus TaxID=6289 RepID=A0A7I4Y929_HAECO